MVSIGRVVTIIQAGTQLSVDPTCKAILEFSSWQLEPDYLGSN